MLVLGRKEGESVTVEGVGVVKVLRIRGNQVTLGFDAPRTVLIFRDEVDQQQRADRGNGRPSDTP